MSEPTNPGAGTPTPQPAPATGITEKPLTPAGGVVAVSATAPAPSPAPAPKPAAKPAAKPVAKAGPTRRIFLVSAFFGSWFATAWTTFTLSMIAMVLGTVRFLFPNVLSEPPSVYKAGGVGDYEEGKVDDKYKEFGFWVIRSKDDSNRDIIYALSTICTHLGCNPNWLDADKKFKCPCHGSGFRISGVNFEGPAPRPLERHAIRRTDDGQIVVDKSRKFQKEIGQWDDADSYILM